MSVLYRANILHFDTATSLPHQDATVIKDGALVVLGDRIIDLGDYAQVASRNSNYQIKDYRGKLIVPGLIDSHLHFPQTEMIAKYGEQLLAWLDNYTFPTENKFNNKAYCDYIAKHFVAQLINNGTTTAFAYATVHRHSVDALFERASHYNMAMITGKMCMDRHCPEDLQDTPESAQKQSAALIEKWHNKGRNLYALTPRFAPTSTEKQLALLGELALEHPTVFLQTHLSENLHEIAWVKNLFSQHTHYLDVYDHYNMVHSRSLFGHCLHLQDCEWQRLAEAGSTAVFCPTSNLFLGSGLFAIEKAHQHKVSVALATDVGAGTGFNMLKTYGEAYKIGQLQQQPLCALTGLYMMTQGPAVAYGLEHQIGNLNPHTYADFVVLDPYFNALSQLRFQGEQAAQLTTQRATHERILDDVQDIIFALSFIGDDRAVHATYIAGKECKQLLQEENYAMV